MEKKESDGNHSVKISVIVPVYNAENTIEKSLSNLLHQTMLEKRENGIKILPEIEILLINDCSTDNSLAILNKIQNDYPNLVKVIDLPENHGPGGARNYGLDVARGEYIGFMDGDDSVDITMYEKLYAAVRTEKVTYDVADCAIWIGKGQMNFLYTHPDTWGILDDEKRAKLLAVRGYTVTRIFRRELLEQYHIRFREHEIMEDQDFLSEVIARANSVTGVMEVLYDYKDMPDSASKKNFDFMFYEDVVHTIMAIYDKLTVIPSYKAFAEGAEFAYMDLLWKAADQIDRYVKEQMISQELAQEMYSGLHQIREQVVKGKIRENRFAGEYMQEHMVERIMQL